MLQHTVCIRTFGATACSHGPVWESLKIIKFILVSEMKGTKQTEWHFDLQMNNLLLLLYLPRPQGQV